MARAPKSKPLQLLAADGDDLKVVSAAVQDAVCTVGDIVYEQAAQRLTMTLNRFRWEMGSGGRGGERVRAALQLGAVRAVKARRLRRDIPSGVIELLSVSFEQGDAPAGVVVFTFAGDGELRLGVDYVDAVLADLSAPWPARRRPSHDLSES